MGKIVPIIGILGVLGLIAVGVWFVLVVDPKNSEDRDRVGKEWCVKMCAPAEMRDCNPRVSFGCWPLSHDGGKP